MPSCCLNFSRPAQNPNSEGAGAHEKKGQALQIIKEKQELVALFCCAGLPSPTCLEHCSGGSTIRLGARQLDAHSGADILPAFDTDIAAMLGDERLDQRQAQASAFTRQHRIV